MPHLAEKTLALVLVDPHYFFQEPEVITALARNGTVGGKIFRETGTTVAQPRVQKLPADTRVGADTFPHLIDVRANRFANSCNRIDEADLHRQEGVGSILDQL